MTTPKKIKTTTVKEELPPDPEPTVDLSGDGSNIGLLLQQFEESGLSVEIYRDENGHMEYCETIRGSHAVDKDVIRDNWGGGKFTLKIYDGAEHITSITFRIAKKPLTNPANGNNATERLMQEQNAFFQRMILAMMTKQNGGGSDLSLKDMLEIVTKIANPVSPTAMIDTLLKGMELGKGAGASADWKAELVHGIKDVATAVVPAFVQVAAASKGIDMHNAPIAVLPEDLIKQAITNIKGKVVAGLPVSLALDWIVVNAGEYQPLITSMLKDGYEKFEALDPDLKSEPFKTWFTKLYEGLKNAYAGNTDDEDSDRDAGDNGNLASHGGVS